MRIEFDPAKDALNRGKHHLSLEIAAGFTNTMVVRAKMHGAERRYLMIGRIEDGVFAAIVTRRANRVRIISLRRASRKERRLYAEHLRETGR